jgi:hypothetical protein
MKPPKEFVKMVVLMRMRVLLLSLRLYCLVRNNCFFFLTLPNNILNLFLVSVCAKATKKSVYQPEWMDIVRNQYHLQHFEQYLMVHHINLPQHHCPKHSINRAHHHHPSVSV